MCVFTLCLSPWQCTKYIQIISISSKIYHTEKYFPRTHEKRFKRCKILISTEDLIPTKQIENDFAKESERIRLWKETHFPVEVMRNFSFSSNHFWIFFILFFLLVFLWKWKLAISLFSRQQQIKMLGIYINQWSMRALPFHDFRSFKIKKFRVHF